MLHEQEHWVYLIHHLLQLNKQFKSLNITGGNGDIWFAGELMCHNTGSNSTTEPLVLQYLLQKVTFSCSSAELCFIVGVRLYIFVYFIFLRACFMSYILYIIVLPLLLYCYFYHREIPSYFLSQRQLMHSWTNLDICTYKTAELECIYLE